MKKLVITFIVALLIQASLTVSLAVLFRVGTDPLTELFQSSTSPLILLINLIAMSLTVFFLVLWLNVKNIDIDKNIIYSVWLVLTISMMLRQTIDVINGVNSISSILMIAFSLFALSQMYISEE